MDCRAHESPSLTPQRFPGSGNLFLEIALNPALVILDPIQLYLGPKVDMNRSNEVRPLLTELAQLGNEFACAMVLVAHPPKGEQSKAIYRVAGSFDFSGTVRSLLIIDRDPDNPQTQSVMVHSKNNGGPKGMTQVFRHTEGQFQWVGTSILTDYDLEGPPRGPSASSRNKCKDWGSSPCLRISH